MELCDKCDMEVRLNYPGGDWVDGYGDIDCPEGGEHAVADSLVAK